VTEYWEPRTERDIQAALDQGFLKESHVLDVKKQPPPPIKNLDIAVDIASFAADGGRILYGVDQPVSSGPTRLSPFDFAGLAERFDQIARGGSIDPPVRLRCVDIPSETHPGQGYLLLVIPRSSQAPHMVDGRYRCRSDRTNSIMSDAEVRRLAGERAARQQDIAALLEEEVERDPTDNSLRTQGHLFIVAQPLSGSPNLLSTAIGSQDWRNWLRGPFRDAVWAAGGPTGLAPDLFNHATGLAPRPSGWAISTYEVGDDRRVRPNGLRPAEEDNLLDLEVRDDGGLRLFCARASYMAGGRSVTFINLIVLLTRRLVRAAGAVAAKGDFLGEWGFGVAIRGIGESSLGLMLERDPRFVQPYDEVTTCSAEQLRQAPDDVAHRLLGKFFRGLGIFDFIPGLDS
jgi:hypothetical protein